MNEIATYLPEQFRRYLQEHYYARITDAARLEHALEDPEFLRAPGKSVSLYGDHGAVHARDVAARVLHVLDAINGVLIPRREDTRLVTFMKAYGVLVAYLHDIGMAVSSPFGRSVHAEYATQQVFETAFDQVVDALWAENCGGIAGRLQSLAAADALQQPARIVFREMLAMVNCHSKSAVPVTVLNDLAALRHLMQDCLGTSLRVIYRRRQDAKSSAALREGLSSDHQPLNDLPSPLAPADAQWGTAIEDSDEDDRGRERLRVYTDFQREAFSWLVSSRPEVRDLVCDVVDTLRAVRCADALRRRGTVLITSAGYEVFVDGATGGAVYALRRGDGQLFLLRELDPIGAGEANVAGSEFQRDGSLRISFHRGSFATQEATRYAAHCAALVINDIQLDVVGSFQHPAGEDRLLKGTKDIQIIIENVDDNPQFASLVSEQLRRLNPQIQDQLREVTSLQLSSPRERARYIAALGVPWDLAERQAVLRQLERSGQRTAAIDVVHGFEEVKLTTLRAGETLIEAGTPAGFVYIPLEAGLQILPLAGYQTLPTPVWIPVGSTGVIRGATRNATIVADRDLTLLMIPRNVYLQHWYHPYNAADLLERLRS